MDRWGYLRHHSNPISNLVPWSVVLALVHWQYNQDNLHLVLTTAGTKVFSSPTGMGITKVPLGVPSVPIKRQHFGELELLSIIDSIIKHSADSSEDEKD